VSVELFFCGAWAHGMRAGYRETVCPFLLSIERGKVDNMASIGEDLAEFQDGC
jgi:hypothetical protein